MFLNNKNFYPTPKHLIAKMVSKLRGHWDDINYILEPSAGKGDIIDYIKEINRGSRTIHAIEKDKDLNALLIGKFDNISVIDYDFLSYCGNDKYDLIIANPPFDEGDKHLLKAIDIMYSGHIVFLLNAETIRNPYSNLRKLLVDKLTELNADIEYIKDGFTSAERATAVEIALIHIEIKRNIEDDLFEGMTEKEIDINAEAGEQTELASKESLRELVADYNRKIEIGTKTIIDFYKNYHHVRKYLFLTSADSEERRNDSTYDCDSKNYLTNRMKKVLNDLIMEARRDYWTRALDLKCISDRLTKKKQDEFYEQLKRNENVDFTESNVLAFITKLIGSYEQTLNEAVDQVFNSFTREFAWDKDIHGKNVHYFNGWVTNKAFMVNSKVILPFYKVIVDTWTKKVRYDVRPNLDDIDKVMNLFDGGNDYVSIADAIDHSDDCKNIESTYFIISYFNKGTLHLTFKDESIRRRFNVTACRGRQWLPHNYGQGKYEDLSAKEKLVVDEFEGKESYIKHIDSSRTLYAKKNLKQLPFATEINI